ncbi:hypothetical protein M3Y94_00445700 [Aphelenchoides besseyi]|nr:hypothetical protein M3Y94_00445700 [Aphelenchoides besseyi]
MSKKRAVKPTTGKLENTNESTPTLTELTPYSRKIMLDGLSYKEIVKIAMLNEAHYTWVKHYFDEMRAINIKINGSKYCLSREPCYIASYRCRHRLFRKIDGLSLLIKLGLIHVRSIYIEALCQPKTIRAIMSSLRKVCAMLNELRYIFC